VNILEEANEIIHGPRNEDYGHPADNHGLTAKYWNIYIEQKFIDDKMVDFRKPLTAEDVCILNILQKISRHQHSPKRDNLVDIAGYAGNIEMIWEKNLPKDV